MGELINGRTPEEIKRRLKCASFDCSDINCDDCEYIDICESVVKRGSADDALALIEHYEQRIAKLTTVLSAMGVTVHKEKMNA